MATNLELREFVVHPTRLAGAEPARIPRGVLHVIKPEFILGRNGKPVVLYAGLLDLAHAQGLKRIQTHLVQIPSEDNGQTAIVAAEVEPKRGIFSGIGDASPANVARPMLTVTIRLAETRAKARALRDAVNVGVVALEELGDGDVDQVESRPAVAVGGPTTPSSAPPVQGARAAAASGPTSATVTQRVDTTDRARVSPAPVGDATAAQLRTIAAIAREHDISEAQLAARLFERFSVRKLEGLTRKQASEAIDALKEGSL